MFYRKAMREKKNTENNNRLQVGSGPTYSDSPSDNVNSSITSSPTDTLRTSKNPTAKIIKNPLPVKANIQKFKNGDYFIDYSNGWNGALRDCENYYNYNIEVIQIMQTIIHQVESFL